MSGRFIPKRKISPGVGDNAMPVHYQSDGKGRDSYIVSTDGGLTYPNKPCDPRVVFSLNLRKYSRIDNYLEQRNYNLANLAAGAVFRRNSQSIITNKPYNKIELGEKVNFVA